MRAGGRELEVHVVAEAPVEWRPPREQVVAGMVIAAFVCEMPDEIGIGGRAEVPVGEQP